MYKFLGTTGLALMLAAPVMAQTQTQTATATAPTTAANPYAQQAAQIFAEEAQLPAGGDLREHDELEWKAEVAHANADRVGMPFDLAAIRTQVMASADRR
jgi:hypothetical protein